MAKQVRLVLKSPSWITHESTSELFQRYNFEDPIAQLARALEARRAKTSVSVVAFDTPERQQWHSLLPSFFALPPGTQDNAALRPSSSLPSRACRKLPVSSHRPSSVRRALRPLPRSLPCVPTSPSPMSTSRTRASRNPASERTLRVLRVLSAQPASRTPTVATTKRASQLLLREKFMRYAQDGMPTCALCLRRFAKWPPFLNRRHTNSCPAIDHADVQSTRSPAL